MCIKNEKNASLGNKWSVKDIFRQEISRLEMGCFMLISYFFHESLKIRNIVDPVDT